MRFRAEQSRRIVWGLSAIPFLASSAFGQAAAPKPAPAAPTTATSKPDPVKPGPGKPATPKAGASKPDAKKLLASAETKRAAGDYEGALGDYQAADAVAPSPTTIEGIAFCDDKLGHFDEALTWYDGFLANPPPALQEQANAATARVAAIKAMPGQLHLESLPSNALVTVDGKEAPTHTPVDLDLLPGKHTLHVTAPEHDAVDKDVTIVSRAKQSVALELLVTPPPPPPVVAAAPPPPPPPPPPRSLLPAYVSGGLAVVAAGIGAGFGIAALNDKSNFNKKPTTATANDGEDHALISDMGFGIALTLGVTSVILFTTRNEQTAAVSPATPSAPAPAAVPEPPKPSALAVPTFLAAPFVTPHGGGAGAVVRF